MNIQLLKSDEVFSYYLPHKQLYPYITYYSIQYKSFSTIAPLFIPDLGGSIIITINDLSNDVHYSTRHINRYLNALTGVSGKSYIRIKRFNKAVEMLKKSNCSIEQIALSLGYFDAAHFVNNFLKPSGLSPTQYRKNMSGFYNDALKKI